MTVTTTTKQAWWTIGLPECPISDHKPRFVSHYGGAHPVIQVAEYKDQFTHIIFFITEKGEHWSWETPYEMTRYHSRESFNSRMWMFDLPPYLGK